MDAITKLSADMQRKGLAPATVIGVKNTLSLILGRAVDAGYLVVNPCTKLRKGALPSVPKSNKRALTAAEVDALGSHAGDTFKPVIDLMLLTGVRIGEALALRWRDIDRERGVVMVRGQLTRDRQVVEHGKTRAAVREVVLVHRLDALLEKHRAATPWNGEDDFVLANPDGQARGHRTTSRGIERTVKRAGLTDVSAHSFRHTFASMLIVGMKEDAVSVAAMLGHEKPSFTLDVYSHFFREARNDGQRQRLSDGFDRLLNVNADVNTMSTASGFDESSDSEERPANVVSIRRAA